MRKHIFDRITLIALLALATLGLTAQIPNGYYDAANNKTGNELKTALHNIIKGHTTVSYSQLWSSFYSTDHRTDDVSKVWDIYSDIPNGTPPYLYDLGSDQCGNYSAEGSCYNREHSWPESWFSGENTPRTDLHHIFPTDGYVNNQRGNLPYGEVQSASWTSLNGSKVGTCNSSLGYNGTVFEPINAYKGDLARAYFYMSVRYSGEDSGWGSSPMTNKSTILPWALEMLLNWSDNDPVSQKEIDRNNVIYGIQHNRNPFIDHPEYARMIWDPNWSQTTSYNIACVQASNGSVSAPASAYEGTTVAITATPDPGYLVGSYSAYKTGDVNTPVGVSSNGTFTMPGYDVTVSATFVQDLTLYNITLGSVSHGSISANTQQTLSGTTVTLTATPDSGYNLYSWYVYKTGDVNTTVSVSNNQFTMPSFDVTVMASFVQGSVFNGDYVKVTSAPADWSGKYVLVYENSATRAYVWTGVDSQNCYVKKTISNNVIADDGMVSITIAPEKDGYYIRVSGGPNHGYYIRGANDNNELNFVTYPAVNTISFESNSVKIESGTSVMRFNNNAGQMRFRYFKSDTYFNQQPVQLYKKINNAPTYNINFNGNGGTGTMSTQTVNEFEPTALSANTFTKSGYVFGGWNTAPDGSGDYYADGAIVRLLANLTLYAQWEEEPFLQQYHLVTSVDQLVAGRTYLIVNINAGKALSKTQNNNNRSAEDVTITDGNLISNIGEQVCELTLGGQSGAWSFYDASYPGYLSAVTGGNYLRAQASLNDKGKWMVSITSNGVATMVSNGVSDRQIRYNPNGSNPPIFSCYTSGQQDVYLFIRSEEYNHTQSETIARIFPFDKHTVQSGATLTVTGTVSCTNASHLVLEDGAQLLHNGNGVQATVKKSIAAYVSDGGWYTIATPFTTSFTPAEAMVGNNYDLYAYDETASNQGLEWINHKQGNGFGLEVGRGYLYAHNPALTLSMSGTLNARTYSTTVNLSYSNTDEALIGYNLLGNPTAHNITFTTSENVSSGYYYLENDDIWTYSPNNTVPVGRGFLVKANAASQIVTLNPQGRDGRSEEGQYLCIAVGEDKAYVKLDEGVSMPLLDLRGQHSGLYLLSERNPYVMLVRDGANALDLCYEPSRNGKQTLTVNPQGLDLDYLHLIDHLTGKDVDLLVPELVPEPVEGREGPAEYTFYAKTTDYPCRFSLVFNSQAPEPVEGPSAPFAYYNGSEWVVAGTGTLQVIDMMGRVVSTTACADGACTVTTNGIAPGVYMFRLVTSDNVKVQKVVVE